MTTRALFLTPGDGERLDVLGTPMTFLATEAQTDGDYEVVVIEADSSGDSLAHRHPWSEFYLVLDGELEVQVGGRSHLAGPGAFITIPSMAVHSFDVLSERARFLHVSAGSGATAAFREYHEAVPGVPQPEDIPALLEINERHGVEVLVPGIGIVRSLADLDRLGDLSQLEDIADLVEATV
jgi:quercetin dioxygenase-like cupin family protein